MSFPSDTSLRKIYDDACTIAMMIMVGKSGPTDGVLVAGIL